MYVYKFLNPGTSCYKSMLVLLPYPYIINMGMFILINLKLFSGFH
jgi:hypothetical protein